MNPRIPPPLYAVATGLLMYALAHYLPLLRFIHEPWNRLGWLLVGLGLGWDLIALIQFRRRKTTMNPLRIHQATTLVQDGLYAMSRNPMYLGLTTVLTGWAVVLGSALPFILVGAFAQTLVWVQILPEEAALENRFGQTYSAYKQRVGRWLGRRRSSSTTDRGLAPDAPKRALQSSRDLR